MLRIAASVARPARTTRSIEVTAFSMFGVAAFSHRKQACAFESNEDNGWFNSCAIDADISATIEARDV
jgi:hypothetical protein